MSFSNTAETAVLNQVFVGTALPWNANTDLWIALHTADPGEAGTAITSEAAYGSYARVTLTRASDFTVSGNQVSNANLEQFPQCSSGSETITYCSIVTTSSGAGTIIARAALNTPIPVSTGIQPQFAAGALVFTLD
jgi:hypothetical protein